MIAAPSAARDAAAAASRSTPAETAMPNRMPRKVTRKSALANQIRRSAQVHRQHERRGAHDVAAAPADRALMLHSAAPDAWRGYGAAAVGIGGVGVRIAGGTRRRSRAGSRVGSVMRRREGAGRWNADRASSVPRRVTRVVRGATLPRDPIRPTEQPCEEQRGRSRERRHRSSISTPRRPSSSSRRRSRRRKELALDTEGASFHRFVDRIYLLQLSTRDATRGHRSAAHRHACGLWAGCSRIQPSRSCSTTPTTTCACCSRTTAGRCANIFDTRIAAQLLGYTAFGLAALLERFFDVKLDKKHQRADWSMRPLTADMLDYAAQDTRYLLELKDQLSAELRAHGPHGVGARGVRACSKARAGQDEEPGMAFLQAQGRARPHSSRARGAARARAVARRGRRRSSIARPSACSATSSCSTSRARSHGRGTRSGKIKGMPRGILEQRGGELLDAVQRALAVPEAELPKFPRAARGTAIRTSTRA